MQAQLEAAPSRVGIGVMLENKTGLHYRRASVFVRAAREFEADIKVSYEKKVVDGKSILGMMNLGASQGAVLIIEAAGEDAEQAIAALQALIHNKLGAAE